MLEVFNVLRYIKAEIKLYQFPEMRTNQVSHDALRQNLASPILQSRKKVFKRRFSLVEYTGIKTLKGWISSYIESSLYMFCKKCLCSAKNNCFYPLQFNVSGHIIITNGAMAK